MQPCIVLENNATQVVDLVMMTSLEDMQPEDVDASPLIALSCGHVFTVETLDGSLSLSRWEEHHLTLTALLWV